MPFLLEEKTGEPYVYTAACTWRSLRTCDSTILRSYEAVPGRELRRELRRLSDHRQLLRADEGHQAEGEEEAQHVPRATMNYEYAVIVIGGGTRKVKHPRKHTRACLPPLGGAGSR